MTYVCVSCSADYDEKDYKDLVKFGRCGLCGGLVVRKVTPPDDRGLKEYY